MTAFLHWALRLTAGWVAFCVVTTLIITLRTRGRRPLSWWRCVTMVAMTSWFITLLVLAAGDLR